MHAKLGVEVSNPYGHAHTQTSLPAGHVRRYLVSSPDGLVHVPVDLDYYGNVSSNSVSTDKADGNSVCWR